MTQAELPAPLTPIECDLRGYEFMPLFGQRMFGSRFYSLALRSPRAGLAGMKLWWEAWTQCPAGSLPDDDFDLARMADFGSDLKGWRAVKAIALHGFVLCSDGRLYHPVLASEAIDAWERRRKERARKAEQRAKRGGTDGNPGADGPRPVPPPVPRDNARDTAQDAPRTEAGRTTGHAQEVPSDRTGQDRTGTGQRKKEAADAPVASREPTPISRITDNPRRSDPPQRWMHLAEKSEVDPKMITRPVVCGFYLDVLADLVLTAAGINDANWRGDWQPLIRWLKAGYSDEHILAAVRQVAARPSYRPPSTLAYFDGAVGEQRRVA